MNYYFPKNCSTHIRNKSHFINSTNNPVGYRFQPLKVNYNINNHLKNVTNVNSKIKKKKHNDSDSNSNSSSSSSSESVVNISFSLKDKIFSPGDKEDPNMSIYNKSQSNYHKRNYSSGNFQSQKSFDECYSNNNTISSNNINDDVNDIYNNNSNKEKGDILSQIEQFKIDIGSFLEENDSLLKNNIPKGNPNYETNIDKADNNNDNNNNYMESQGIEVNIND